MTPQYWLACYDYCRAGSKHFGCVGCPACTGHVDQFDLCEDCNMDLLSSAAELIRGMVPQTPRESGSEVVQSLGNICTGCAHNYGYCRMGQSVQDDHCHWWAPMAGRTGNAGT